MANTITLINDYLYYGCILSRGSSDVSFRELFWSKKSQEGNYDLNHTRLKLRYELAKLLNSVLYPLVGANYLHYKEAIKVLPSLKNSVLEAWDSLEKRGVISLLFSLKILESHLSGKEEHLVRLY